MLSDKYFYQDPPKSTGFEKFNIQWIEKYKDKFQLSRSSLIALLPNSLQFRYLMLLILMIWIQIKYSLQVEVPKILL